MNSRRLIRQNHIKCRIIDTYTMEKRLCPEICLIISRAIRRMTSHVESFPSDGGWKRAMQKKKSAPNTILVAERESRGWTQGLSLNFGDCRVYSSDWFLF